MMTEPQGQVYMVYDAVLQEAELTEDVKIPPTSAIKVPPRLTADPKLIEEAADMMLAAEAEHEANAEQK